MNSQPTSSLIFTAACAGLAFVATATRGTTTAAADEPSFFRAINLNGPALTIDDHPWEAGDATGVTCNDAAFEDQSVRLVPETDRSRARMIRSSRWSPQGQARIRVSGLAAGAYSVHLYVWEDNDAQTFDIRIGDAVVARNVNSGNAGQWQRLGPWIVEVVDGAIELAAVGGHANLSGLEIWHGKLSPEQNPLPGAIGASASMARESRVAVLLARHCLECHNPAERKGGLDLTRREHALAGGDDGPVLKPGDADGSRLLQRVEAGEMPPSGRTPLAADERELLRRWISDGAKWAADPIDQFLYTTDRRAGYNWWSLQPLRAVEPPQVADARWPANPIDNFVLARLEEAGLSPSPRADSRTLMRRVYFDLIGLPPTPEEVEHWTNRLTASPTGRATSAADPARGPLSWRINDDAYRELVDELLDSPHYGERWARHWLDLVRYGESQGFERNKFRDSAWKYRDFVVEAFNADLPYDEFIRWQLAGDVLHPDDPLAVIASGFLAMGPYDLTAYNNGLPEMRAFAREEELEGLVATVCQTFLGLTANCARCHDHKFDPVTQREFYQISAALGGTYQGDERESLPPSARAEVEQRIAALRAEIDLLSNQEKSASPLQQRTLAARRSRLEAVIKLLSGGPVHTTVPQQPGPWHVLARGDFRQPGDVVAPRGITALNGVAADWQLDENATEADRRKALSDWIADGNNPLTPRVIVNRLWGWHFGRGLVPTPSDFGFQGGRPSHPELLDWLAGQLVDPSAGPAWSLKRIQRLIVTSATYQQTSSSSDPQTAVGPPATAVDPQSVDADNLLLWRQAACRLDAETFRDTVLAVSGELDPHIGGPGFRDFTVSSAGNNETYTVFDAVGPEFNRRSIYRSCVRSGTSPLLDALDCPDPSVAAPRRSVTSTPLQALMLLNNRFMEHHAARFAERLQREAPDGPAAQVRLAYTLAQARQPAADETDFARRYIAEHGLAEFCLVLFNLNEFVFVD
jgi:mono/diheme cytochrome c family protein